MTHDLPIPLPPPEWLDPGRVLFYVAGVEVMLRDLWVVGTAICCSVACGLLGCFLVLRRMSLLGDAISHAILPGLALAFLLSGGRNPLVMLAGAAAAGLLTSALSAGLHRWGRVNEDAAMGVVFSSLFALGVLLITWAASSVDLDPGCVLYGLIEFAGDDTIVTASTDAAGEIVRQDSGVPRPLVWLAIVLLVNIGAVTLFFKELKLVCFDSALATSMGINAALVHYGLMTLVAVTTIASFESVGSILVVCMLVAPGATASLLTDRLARMLWISAALAGMSSIVGYALALRFDTSVAGMMSVIAGALFALAVVAAPRHGILSRLARRAALSIRIAREDLLADLYRLEECGIATPAQGLTHGLRLVVPGRITFLADLLARVRRETATSPAGARSLTEKGRARAVELVRAHRLWETFLARNLPLPLDHLHEPSHRVEHFLTPDIKGTLSEEVPASTDPHGKAIPRIPRTP